jgi:t-SNARE complex subunit (syntaxin)
MSEEELIEELSSLFNDIEDDEERYTDTIFRKITNLQQENKQLKERIDKAIEYIKENASYGNQEKCCLDDLNYYDCDELLEILGDKE